MTIRILLDRYGMESHSDVTCVNSQADYVPTLRRISTALEGHLPLTVSVHNPAMFSWFDHFRNRDEVSISMIEPARVLAEHLGVAVGDLPDSIRLNPDVIVSDKLVQKAKDDPPAPQQAPLSWLLKKTLGSVWMDTSLSEPSQFTTIVTDYASGRASQVLHPCFLALRDQQVEQWIASGSPYRTALSWLFRGNPSHRARSLILLRLLEQYPRSVQVGALSFEGRWAELAELEGAQELARLLPASCGCTFRILPAVSQEVETYLTEVLSRSGLAGVLPLLSGGLQIEQQVIRAHLLVHMRGLSTADRPAIEQLLHVFKSAGSADTFVLFLDSILPVSEPPALSGDASWADAQRWLEREYMPYYAWTAAVGGVEKSGQQVAEFECWLMKHFAELCRTEAFAPFAFRESVTGGLRMGPILVVVIDGMSWFVGAMLRSVLAKKGIRCKPSSGHVCAIPSITRVAKPSLLAGRMLAQVRASGEDERDYEGLLSVWTGLDRDSCVCGISSRQSIQDLLVPGRRSYLYLYNEIDPIIHKAVEPPIRVRLIQNALELFADDLSRALTSYRNTVGADIGVVMCSDHGYTELPLGSGFTVAPPLSHCDTSHGRIAELPTSSASITDDRFIPLDGALTSDLETVYFVSKGYTCVGTKPRGATHGGLTPQEVYVPQIIVATEAPAGYSDIQVALTGDVRRGRAGNPIAVRIMNPNTVAVDLLELTIDIVTLATVLPCTIEPGDTLDLAGTVDARQVASERLQLGGCARVDCMGDVFVTEFRVQMQTTGAAVADRSFEDSFDV